MRAGAYHDFVGRQAGGLEQAQDHRDPDTFGMNLGSVQRVRSWLAARMRGADEVDDVVAAARQQVAYRLGIERVQPQPATATA